MLLYFCSFYFLLKIELEKNIQKWKSMLDETTWKTATATDFEMALNEIKKILDEA